MRVVFAFLIVLAIFIPLFFGGGFGLNELLHRCTYDSQCYNHEKCNNKICENACKGKICHIGSLCVARDHTAFCECLTGYAYDKNLCRKTCSNNITCSESDVCKRNKCFNACEDHTCKSNEVCKANDDHSYSCLCQPGLVRAINGNGCEISFGFKSSVCSTDTECHEMERCDNGECINACNIHDRMCDHENEGCLVHNRTPTCVCLPNFRRSLLTTQCESIY